MHKKIPYSYNSATIRDLVIHSFSTLPQGVIVLSVSDRFSKFKSFSDSLSLTHGVVFSYTKISTLCFAIIFENTITTFYLRVFIFP